MRVATNSIAEVVPEGVDLTTGEIVKLDMLACTTGFDVSSCPRYPLVGHDGIKLADQWAMRPESYLTLAVPSFPYFFKKSERPVFAYKCKS